MTILKRILFFITLFFLYIILKEFLQFYHYARSLHPYAGYAALALVAAVLVYFVMIPLLRILWLPGRFSPVRDPDKIRPEIKKRIRHLQKNPIVLETGLDVSALPETREGYEKVMNTLRPEVEKIRKKYVTQIFYTTAIAQNGFLDALFILSAGVNMVKDIFLLYRGRVSNRELAVIGRMVYVSMAIGGSEGIEYAMDEIVSRVFSGGMKGIPFASKILGSLADGFINAALLTRIALITDNYCRMVFIESERALYPSFQTVISTTRILTTDLIERILGEVKNLARERTGQVVLSTVNPVGRLLAMAMHRTADHSEKLSARQREWLREAAAVADNPFSAVLKKMSELFRRKRDDILEETL